MRHALAEKGRQLGIILRRAAELNIMPNNNQQHQIVHGNHFIHNDSESRQMVLNPHGNAIVSPGSISPLIQATALTSTNQQLCSDDLNNLKAHKAAMDECHDTIARLGQENDFLQEQV